MVALNRCCILSLIVDIRYLKVDQVVVISLAQTYFNYNNYVGNVLVAEIMLIAIIKTELSIFILFS